MENFTIISDAEKDIGHGTAEDIKRYLESYGKCARIVGDLAQIGEEIRTDMAIVLGETALYFRRQSDLPESRCLFSV